MLGTTEGATLAYTRVLEIPEDTPMDSYRVVAVDEVEAAVTDAAAQNNRFGAAQHLRIMSPKVGDLAIPRGQVHRTVPIPLKYTTTGMCATPVNLMWKTATIHKLVTSIGASQTTT